MHKSKTDNVFREINNFKLKKNVALIFCVKQQDRVV